MNSEIDEFEKKYREKMIKEKQEYDKRKEVDSDLIFNEKDNKKKSQIVSFKIKVSFNTVNFGYYNMGISFVLVNCDMGSEIETVSKLKEFCDEVQGTYGIFDFVCKVSYDSMDSFEQTLLKIRKTEKITHTNTIHTIPEQS